MKALALLGLLGAAPACIQAGAAAYMAAAQTADYPGPVKHMQSVDTVDTTPKADEAVVVFMRPKGAAPGVQYSVFDVVEKEPASLIGILGAMKKVAYRTAPGRHLFMGVATGGGADFITAKVDGGKLYYVLVMPGEGGFALQPVRASAHRELTGTLASTGWVVTNSDSLAWAQENADDIEARRFKYYGIWRHKPSFERLALFPDDGQ